MNPDQKPTTSWGNFWEKAKELAVQALVIIAAILLVIFVSWGIIKLVPAVISSLSSGSSFLTSIFKPKESLTVTATPETVASGKPITFSWKHVSRSAEGSYGIAFACAPGLTMKLRNTSGGDQTIPCGKNVPVGDALSAVLTGTSIENRLVEIPVTISFVKTNGTVGVTKHVSVKITNDSSTLGGTTDTETKPKPTVVKKPATTGTVYRGPSDLAVSLISATTDTIRFRVANIGGSASGAWSFSTNINNNGTLYSSPLQSSIGAGSGVIFTLSYGAGSLNGANSVTINLSASDTNKANNSLSVPAYGTGGGVTGYGLPDLFVRILDVDGNTNGYYGGNNGSHTVRVEVKNIGTNTSGTWSYTAQLPITCQNVAYNNSIYGNSNITCNGANAVYTGVSQAPLAAGASLIVSVVFTNGNNQACTQTYPNNCYQSTGGAFLFVASPNGFQELRTDNNSASTYVQG